MLDASFGVLGYYFFGWAFAYGDHSVCDEAGNCTITQNGFIGGIINSYDSFGAWLQMYQLITP